MVRTHNHGNNHSMSDGISEYDENVWRVKTVILSVIALHQQLATSAVSHKICFKMNLFPFTHAHRLNRT